MGQRSAENPAGNKDRVSDDRRSLGKYRIEKKIGSGGMGTVFLAVDTDLNRTVALKVLPKSRAKNPTLVRRFQSEGKSAALLEHENIVKIFDAGQVDGFLYIALEYVDGIDVYDLVTKRGPLPIRRSIDLMKQAVRALQHLHERNVVHRDVKPSNMLIRRDGSLKLTDLGLARSLDETLETDITRAGTTVGTVDYMSPEQSRNSKSADIRSDIYSLGCSWYFMLTGHPPFNEGSVTNKLNAHAMAPPPDPRQVNENIPEGVVAVMHRMMAKSPEHRHQDPAELLEDLEGAFLSRTEFDENALNLLAEEADHGPATIPAMPQMPKRRSRKSTSDADDDDEGSSIHFGPWKIAVGVGLAVLVLAGLALLVSGFGSAFDSPGATGDRSELTDQDSDSAADSSTTRPKPPTPQSNGDTQTSENDDADDEDEVAPTNDKPIDEEAVVVIDLPPPDVDATTDQHPPDNPPDSDNTPHATNSRVDVVPEWRLAGTPPQIIRVDLTRADLGRVISENRWKDGALFVASGHGVRVVSPIRVKNKSLRIRFEQTAGLPLILNPRTVSLRNLNRRRDPFETWISITEGSIEIEGGTFRIPALSQATIPRWFLHVQEGSFSLKNCHIQGPMLDAPRFEGLIQWSAAKPGISQADSPFQQFGQIVNCFFTSGADGILANAPGCGLRIRNSVLVAMGDLLTITHANGEPTVLDLAQSTLSTTDSYFYASVDDSPADEPAVQLFVAESVFAPPVEIAEGEFVQPTLLIAESDDVTNRRIGWFERRNGYSASIHAYLQSPNDLTNSPQSFAKNWQPLWKPEQIQFPLQQPGEVLLQSDLPHRAKLTPADFALLKTCKAAKWSEEGGPIGADVQSLHRPAPGTFVRPDSETKTNADPSGILVPDF